MLSDQSKKRVNKLLKEMCRYNPYSTKQDLLGVLLYVADVKNLKAWNAMYGGNGEKELEEQSMRVSTIADDGDISREQVQRNRRTA